MSGRWRPPSPPSGYPVQISLRLAEPPAASSVCIQLADCIDDNVYPLVVAAHRDSLLICIIPLGQLYLEHAEPDYFVYNAGTVTTDALRLPSLWLLPHCCIAGPHQSREVLHYGTSLIRHGKDDDELVVAELRLLREADTPGLMTPVLLLFRSGEWIVKCPRISHGGQEFLELLSWSTADPIVIPMGDRRLCWASLSITILICDVFEVTPLLQYVELPVDPSIGELENNYNVSVTTDNGTLRFINVFPGCRFPDGAYVINNWTLKMSDMEWVKDGMVDITELWALDADKGLPRVPLYHPVVSIDEPYIICFVLIETDDVMYDRTIWMLMVDPRSKTI